MSQSTAASTPAGPSAPPSSSTPSSHPQLAPGTFRPILPLLDEILSVLQGQATSEKPVGGIEAGESVAKKVRRVNGIGAGVIAPMRLDDFLSLTQAGVTSTPSSPLRPLGHLRS
jgi:hypothetical protein